MTTPKDLNRNEILALFKDEPEQLPTGSPVLPLGGFRGGEMMCLPMPPRSRPSILQRLATHLHSTGDSVFMVSLETTPEQAVKAYVKHLGVELDKATLDRAVEGIYMKLRED